jgi:transposase
MTKELGERKELSMKIIGCDFHPSFQKIAIFDSETGEIIVLRLSHANEEATRFYQLLPEPVVVGVESSGNMRWFQRLLARLGHSLWIGDASRIRANAPRKQKTDERDALNILDLLLEKRFPSIWVPTMEELDLRQLLKHRHTLVQMRTRVKNQLQHIAMNEGFQKKRKLWTKEGLAFLRKMELGPWTGRRRDDLLQLLEQLHGQIQEMNQAAERAAAQQPLARLLMTHPGVGPILALATVLTLGTVERFPRSKNVISYVGLIPSEDSSGMRRRLGGITKQGNSFMRFLLVQAGMVAARHEAELGRFYKRLVHKKHHGVAKVAVARKLLVRLYWMLRTNTPYPEVVDRMQGSSSHSVVQQVKTETLNGRPASRKQSKHSKNQEQ